MNRTGARLLLACLTATATLAVGNPAAEATSPVRFGRIQYDSPGSDDRSNTSLDNEYAVVRNTSTAKQCLTKWTLRDAQSHVYTFGTFCLAGGKSVTVRTGHGTNGAYVRYWGSGNYIWNNTGDTAYLRNASGAAIATCRWTTTSPGYKNC